MIKYLDAPRGILAILRGGSRGIGATFSRLANRGHNYPSTPYTNRGLRIVLVRKKHE